MRVRKCRLRKTAGKKQLISIKRQKPHLLRQVNLRMWYRKLQWYTSAGCPIRRTDITMTRQKLYIKE